MIKNEQQYKITLSRANGVRRTIGELQDTPLPDGLQPQVRQLQIDALLGTLSDLCKSMSAQCVPNGSPTHPAPSAGSARARRTA